MKKITILVALMFISAITFAQIKQGKSNFSAVRTSKIINNLLPGAKAIVDSLHYDVTDNYDGIGTNAAATHGVYCYYPASLTSAHNAVGNTITSVKLYISNATVVTSAALKIFSDQGVTSLLSQPFTAVEGWNEVVLTTPLAIPTTPLYIGYEVVVTGGYPLGCDSSTVGVPNGNWIIYNGTWQHLTDLNADLTGSWNIRAMVDGTALTTPVALCSPETWNAGQVIVGNSVTSPTVSLQNIGAGTLTVSGITGLSAPYTTTLVPASVSLTAGQSATFAFTFTPTVAGAADQTVTIATNVGNVTVALSGSGLVCTPATSLPWTEGFEATTFPPTCWSIVDANADATTWDLDDSHPHGGTNHASYYYTASNAGDDWLITSPTTLAPGNYQLSYYYRARSATYPEAFTVAYGSASTVAAMTNTIGTHANIADTVYIQGRDNFTIATAGTYYFGFHATSDADMWALYLDDITLAVNTGISESAAEVVSVFPNPANDKLFVSSNHIQTVEIFNLTGAKVASYGNQNMIGISNLAQGTYLVKVITDNKVTTQKINIVR